MAIGGVLASMLRGAGNGTRENARKSIEEEERKQRELREDERYNERLAGERAGRDAHYARVRADQKEDLDAERQHDLAMIEKRSVLGGMGGESPVIKAAKKDYIDAGNYYLSKIKDINESHLDEGEKERQLLYTLEKFQNFVDSTQEIGQYTTMSNVFNGELAMWQDRFMPQGGSGEPSNSGGQPASATTKKPPVYNPNGQSAIPAEKRVVPKPYSTIPGTNKGELPTIRMRGDGVVTPYRAG